MRDAGEQGSTRSVRSEVRGPKSKVRGQESGVSGQEACGAQVLKKFLGRELQAVAGQAVVILPRAQLERFLSAATCRH